MIARRHAHRAVHRREAEDDRRRARRRPRGRGRCARPPSCSSRAACSAGTSISAAAISIRTTKAGNWRSEAHGQKKSRPTWNSRSTSATWSRMAKIVSTSPSARRVSPLRDDHLVALPDQADERRLGQLGVADRLAGDRRGAEHLGLDHLGLAVADRVDRADAAVADVAQDRGDRGRARVDVGVDAHRRDQADQRGVVDQRDDELRPLGLGADAGEDVGLVVVGQRQHRVHRRDVGLLEQVEVEAVAVQHHGALQRVGGVLGAGAALLDDLEPGAAAVAPRASGRRAGRCCRRRRSARRSTSIVVLPKISMTRGRSSVAVIT